MFSSDLVQLEQVINTLPREEQLWLVERIIHNLRVGSSKDWLTQQISDFEQQLAAMASDPEIQKELEIIDQAFAIAEMDGL
ncbi:MAG: hypothetical protein HC840_26680 [Leptolyngbyaceae cyanobacterium RM2_2_4]|nr:hypothetical protein [Leptolyngbyaceae cyanobacterium SM1_4_3]NJN92465.1 hypothetical protein [Leptolyngbyaceae cyanobacterium SL_5_14]NJO52388.1 hypothetical protein [Leptolyngbyaceae cyanobacterium RM2_2_4]NJO67201.1 hypothetical protein [Leptolyngbyaceae cyanobacterium RM1_405_57]